MKVVWSVGEFAATQVKKNVVRIVQVGSKIKIFFICSRRQIHLNISLVPRDRDSHADFVIKIVDFSNYSVHDDIFLFIQDRCGPHSVDRFACDYNTKLPRFNSRFLQPGTEAVDAFTQDWLSENNWFVPPITHVGNVESYERS